MSFRYLAGVLMVGMLAAVPPGAALAYDSGPARRLDFQGAGAPPAEDRSPAYESGPMRRLDYQGLKAEPGPEAQAPAYKSAPPQRMDFQGSRRPDSGN